MSINKVILLGRLGRDPEVKIMNNGESVANIALATSEVWNDKSGVKQEKTEWHNLVLYRRLAEIAGQYLKKGAQIYVEGRLQTRKWQTKEGQDRYTTEVIVGNMQMLGGKQANVEADPFAQKKAVLEDIDPFRKESGVNPHASGNEDYPF